MALATVLGIFTGLFLGDLCKVFAPWASAYVMILKITILPYLVGAIIHGLGTLSSSQAKQILKKGVFFILLAWIINLGMIYLINFTFPQAKGGSAASFVTASAPSIDFAEILIPENIFYALANNIVPAVVVFSVLVGIALMHLKKKERLMFPLETIVDALTRVTAWISRITPIGTFLIMANQVGTVQLSLFKQVGTYLILYIIGTSLIAFWVFPRLASMLTHTSALRWLKLMLPILLLAYTTNVVIVCLPYIMELILIETERLYPKDDRAQSPIQGIVSVVFNLPLASLFIIVFVLFCALFYQTPMTLTGHIQLLLTSFLTSLGAVGLGSWVNSLNFLLDTLNMPAEALNLYLTTLPFVAGFQSMLSAMEIASVSLFITLACRKLILWRWGRICKSSLITLAPLFLIFLGLKIFNPLPPIERGLKTICDIGLKPEVNVTFIKEEQLPALSLRHPNEDLLTQVITSKILRVGYNTNVPPFCFINSMGQVSGYDIAFAYQLADDLGCDLELVPLHYETLTQDLQRGLYDIGMSAISITAERLKSLCFSEPYMESQLVFVYHRDLRKTYPTLQTIEEDHEVKIAVLEGSSFISVAKELFPAKQLVELKSYTEFINHPDEILLWTEQEAISWVIRQPQYFVLFPKPSLGVDVFGYAIRAEEDRFLCFVNQWLSLKRNQGFRKAAYNLWILGKTEETADVPPRWSIIRDVLHWTHD
jgi:Na+/H+-dicarboxylate symporter/ABC-type amino acid transport substrate-binding protein